MDVKAKGEVNFTRDQERLEAFCKEQGIKVLDDCRTVLQITDRLYFNDKMVQFLGRQAAHI